MAILTLLTADSKVTPILLKIMMILLTSLRMHPKMYLVQCKCAGHKELHLQ